MKKTAKKKAPTRTTRTMRARKPGDFASRPCPWRWLTFDDSGPGHTVAHGVHESLVDVAIADLQQRYPDHGNLASNTALPQLVLDVPGMAITTRPIEEFNVDGLKLEIPSEDLSAFAQMLMMPPREYAGAPTRGNPGSRTRSEKSVEKPATPPVPKRANEAWCPICRKLTVGCTHTVGG